MSKLLTTLILAFLLGGCGNEYVNSYDSEDHYVRDLLKKSAVTANPNCEIHLAHSGNEVLRNWLVCPGFRPEVLQTREAFQIREVYSLRLVVYQSVVITYDSVKEQWVVK